MAQQRCDPARPMENGVRHLWSRWFPGGSGSMKALPATVRWRRCRRCRVYTVTFAATQA